MVLGPTPTATIEASSIPDVITSPPGVPASSPRVRLIHFNDEWNILILKKPIFAKLILMKTCVRSICFNRCWSLFCLQCLCSKFRHCNVRFGNNLRPFKNIGAEHAAVHAQNTAASEIVEEMTERSMLMNDVAQHLDDCAGERRAARNEKDSCRQALQKDGENSSAQSLQRAHTRDYRVGKETLTRKRKRWYTVESDDKQTDRLKTHIKRKVSMEDMIA